MLPGYLFHCRGSRARRAPRAARIVETIPLAEDCNPCITIVEVEFTEGEPERYLLPLGFVRGDAARELGERARTRASRSSAWRASRGTPTGSFATRWPMPSSGRLLLDVFERRRRMKGEQGEMIAALTRVVPQVARAEGSPARAWLRAVRQLVDGVRRSARS